MLWLYSLSGVIRSNPRAFSPAMIISPVTRRHPTGSKVAVVMRRLTVRMRKRNSCCRESALTQAVTSNFDQSGYLARSLYIVVLPLNLCTSVNQTAVIECLQETKVKFFFFNNYYFIIIL